MLSHHQRHIYSQARMSRDARFDGRFFVAVKSTGIFCRPVCPARLPKEENVDYYEQASQAIQAGFRPCLRCRPDSAPGSSAWMGADTSFRRAVGLLTTEHALSVEHIAEKLGISTRYLHKLFEQRIGVSPSQFRIYQQLLFAKSLLQSSSLSVTDVAIAAGFQSARRLQANMAKYFALSPSALRKSVGNKPLSSSIDLPLRYRTPYNWQHVWQFLAKRAIPEVEEVTAHGYKRVFHSPQYSGVVVATHDQQHQQFRVSITIDNVAYTRTVFDNVARVLDVNADPQLIEEALVSAGINSETIDKGLRLPGAWSEFEAGCRAIVGQQVSVTVAINLLRRLVVEVGETTSFGPVFPAPSQLMDNALTVLKMPQARKEALRQFARYCYQCEEHHVAIDEQALLAIKGVGPWTVNYLMLRGRSEPDCYLAGDLIVRKMAAQYQVNEENAAPWRSYLTFQLWQLATQQSNS